MAESETDSDFLEWINNPKVTIDEEEKRELKDLFKKLGKHGFELHLENALGMWKKVEVSVAVTGRSGVGKSAFINAFRGLTGDDDGAAEVDAKETTSKATPYPHPLNQKFVLWDLPGAGTKAFPRKTYLRDERVGFDKYDVFLLFYSDRFTEDDMWLAKELKRRKKIFFFVRSKVGQDVDNLKKNKPKLFQKDAQGEIVNLLKKLRDDLKANLESSFEDAKLFLIDSYEIMQYEFENLCDEIVDAFKVSKAEKVETLLFSMHAFTLRVIEEKERILQKRFWKIALLAWFVPLRCGFLNDQANLYLREFGLDTKTLEILASKRGVSLETLTSKLKSVALVCPIPKKGLFDDCPFHSFFKEIDSNRRCLWVSFLGDDLENLKKFLLMCVEDAITLYEIERCLVKSSLQ